MLNINKHTKINLNLNQHSSYCWYVCVYHCVQLSYTTQHRTVVIIFPLILQTIIIAQMMSIGGRGVLSEYSVVKWTSNYEDTSAMHRYRYLWCFGISEPVPSPGQNTHNSHQQCHCKHAHTHTHTHTRAAAVSTSQQITVQLSSALHWHASWNITSHTTHITANISFVFLLRLRATIITVIIINVDIIGSNTPDSVELYNNTL